MQDRRVVPVIKEVFSHRLHTAQAVSIQSRRQDRVAALRRADVNNLTRQVAGMIAREAVDRVAFRHAIGAYLATP